MGNTCVTGGIAIGNSCVTDASTALWEKFDDPAFQWKIYGFSTLLEREAIPAFSGHFYSCGYKWWLVLQVTPMHKNDAGSRYVVLSLELAERQSLKPGLILNAVFELSIYNHSDGTYCRYKDSHNFHVVKNKQSEKSCLIPLDELVKSSDFLYDDSCAFGVRILKVDVPSKRKPVVVPNKPTTVQNLFLWNKELIQGTYSWTINKFRQWKVLISSPTFEVCGHKWYITMYPFGDGYTRDFVCLLLNLRDGKYPPPESGMMIELTLSILDQEHGHHFTHQGRFPFARKEYWGWPYFLPSKTLKDPSKGYLVESKCVVKVDITIIGSYN